MKRTMAHDDTPETLEQRLGPARDARGAQSGKAPCGSWEDPGGGSLDKPPLEG